jgi:hypothetical protein
MHNKFSSPSAAAIQDQAHGLRQLFGHARVRMVPVVANPHMAFGGVMLERLCTAFSEQGSHVLVVDAAESSPTPAEMSVMDLGECIEILSPHVSYLAARGLPLRHVDARGSSAHWLDSLHAAAPHSSALLVHAAAADLARLFPQHAPRPLLLAAEHPESLTHAYAAMKLLALRNRHRQFDLLLAAPPQSRRAAAIAQRLASCAQSFLGASLQAWVAIDPACDVREVPSDALVDLVAAQLGSDGQDLAPLPTLN